VSTNRKVIELEGITKRFGEVLANRNISFDVEAGEIHTLLGENGAGKTTLMNILYGHLQPDEGQIRAEGKRVQFRSPREAIQHGLGMVHQHFMLVPPLTVAENIVMGTRPTGRFTLKLHEVEARIRGLVEQYGLNLDPQTPIAQLSVGLQQRVEILKILYRNARILILDEPTAVLTPLETDELFQTLRSLCRQGYSIIFISHKLSEVMSISDRITVLRQGEVTGTIPKEGTSPSELARMMVGREVFLKVEKEEARLGDVLLEAEGLSAVNDKGLPAINELSFRVHAGEILGFAGVEGNGQRELAEVLSGMRPATSGRMSLQGRAVTGASTRALIEQGLAHIPEDRGRLGFVPDSPIWENAVLENYYQPPYLKNGFLQFSAIRSLAEEIVRQFDVKTSGIDAAIEELSGGNQQKLLVGRELSRDPLVLIASQPTRGLDVGAIEYIHGRLLEQRDKGKALILISTELDEILALSDRIAVLYRGRIMGTRDAGEVDRNTLGLWMLGRQPGEERIA